MDLRFLGEKPDLTEKVTLKIEPLAPLSMSNGGDNNYVSTGYKPNRMMVYGMLENLLGIHCEYETRKQILKDYKLKERISFKSLNPYTPLIHEHLKVGDISVSGGYSIYADFAANLWKHSDTRHIKGVKHMSGDLDQKLYRLYLESYGKKAADITAEETQAKDHCFEKAPYYYGTMIKREYVRFDSGSVIVCEVSTNKYLKDLIVETLTNYRSSAFLGNSESLVNVTV